jgi:hypothetical protein
MLDSEAHQSDEEVLAGGVAHPGAVRRIGDEVERPAAAHTPAVQALFRHVRNAGSTIVPEPRALHGEWERLSFEPGEVPLPPFPEWSHTDAVLASIGRLQRQYHDAVASFAAPSDADWCEELADPEPGTVICHNDICLENVVFRDHEAAVLLDFDFAAPGRPVWDVARTAGMCIPLRPPELAATTGRGHLDPFSRLRVFVDAYELSVSDRRAFIDVFEEVHECGKRFVARHVAAGEPGFVEMWQVHGGAERAAVGDRWFRASRSRLAEAVAPR